jgi:hypothetical protein
MTCDSHFVKPPLEKWERTARTGGYLMKTDGSLKVLKYPELIVLCF